MITCKLLICAKGVIRDAETNTISLYSILENIHPIGFPVLIQDFYVLVYLVREIDDPAKIEFALHLKLNNQDTGAPLQVKVDFQDKFKNRAIVKIEGLFIPNSGPFGVSAYYGNKKLASYEMDVVHAQPTAGVIQEPLKATTPRHAFPVKFRRRKK